MATVNELIDQVWIVLDQNSTFYPPAEVIRSGINPAQRLLCLLRPDLLTHRLPITLVAGQMVIDLRQEAPRLWAIRRVTLGNVSVDPPVKSNRQLHDLTPIGLNTLQRKRAWWLHEGPMENYWRHGREWLGVYRRSVLAETITLVYRAMPTAFRDDQLDGEPDIAEIWHTTIARVAAALLLMKEGGGEIDKALLLLQETLGEEPFGQIRKALLAEERIARGREETVNA